MLLLLTQGPHLENHRINNLTGSMLNLPMLTITVYVGQKSLFLPHAGERDLTQSQTVE